jgi:rhomboid protease GluP
MNPLQTKLRLIYFPFLLLSIGLIVSYTFLNWLLTMRFHLIVLKTETTNLWIPFALPWLPVLIWHRKRIKLLRLKNTSRDPATGLAMLAAFAIIAPLIIAQEFMATNSGSLTTLNNVSEITLAKDSRYYTIQYYAIDRSYTRSHFKREVTGKYNDRLHFTLYVVCPLYDKGHIPVSSQDSAAPPVAWVCKRYTKQISNNLSLDEKQEEKEAFITYCQDDYQSEPVTGYTYFDEIPYSEDYAGYKAAAENSDWYRNNGHLHLLVPQLEPFEKRNGSKLPWIFGSLAIGAAVYFLVLLFIPLDETKVKAWVSGDTKTQKPLSLKESLAWIIPRQGFFATPVIIYLNVLVFLAMVLSGLGLVNFNAGDLLSWGANYGPYISDGQWWRLLTAIFVHAGIMHLLLNMYGLLFVGLFLEPVLGSWRFALYYLASGLIASIASLKIHPDIVGVGASGAIFGMYGVFLACLLTGVFPPGMKKAFLLSTLIFVGANLVMGLSGNTDNAAHIGGLVSGFLIGFFFSRKLPNLL